MSVFDKLLISSSTGTTCTLEASEALLIANGLRVGKRLADYLHSITDGDPAQQNLMQVTWLALNRNPTQ